MLNADGSIQLFYTNVVYDSENNQRLATATINIGQNADGVYIKNIENDHIYFVGDGTVYQNFVQWKNSTNSNINNQQLRDAHIFKDDDGTYYVAFETATGNLGDEANSNIGDNVAMLGFVSDKVDGGFVPLNGDGLVLGASVPATWRTATYTYYVVKINPANIKNDKVTVNGVTYDKDYFVNHVAYMSNRSETVGKGLNATLGPSFLILIDGNKTTVLAQSTTDQGVWDWNENSPKPELAAASLKEAKRSTDSFSYQVKKDGYWYLYTDSTADGSMKMQTGFQYIADQNKPVYYDPATGHMLYGMHWYLFSKKDGHRLTGFQKIPKLNKTVYYSPKTGQMLYGLQKISGKWYMFEKNSGAKITYQKVGTYIRLKHNAAFYSSKGKKTKAKSYKKGLYTKTVGIRIIKGKVYYKLSNGKYIKAVNF